MMECRSAPAGGPAMPCCRRSDRPPRTWAGVWLRFLLALGLVLALAVAAAGGPRWFLPAYRSAELDALVRQLADEDFVRRDQAYRRLDTIGEDALPALRRAAAADDPEVRKRAGE